MAGWYFSVNGKAEGPVGEDVLHAGLKSGRFTLVDLVFREGSAGWTTLGEIPEFRDAYEALPPPQELTPDTKTDKIVAIESKTDRIVPGALEDDTTTNYEISVSKTEAPKFEPSKIETPKAEPPPPRAFQAAQMPPTPAWVVLKKKGSGFEQVGPYTEDQILDRIGRGDIEYSMYAWKPGYKRWVRIGNLPEFDRRKRDRENDPVNQVVPLPRPDQFGAVNGTSVAELARSIETLKRPEPMRPEPPPLETNGVDLIEDRKHPSFKIDPAKDEVRVVPGPEMTDPFVPTSVRSEDEPKTNASKVIKTKPKPLPFLLRAAIAFVVAGFVVVALLAGAQWWNAKRAKDEARRTGDVPSAAQANHRAPQPPPPASPKEDSAADAADEAAESTKTAKEAPAPEPVKKTNAAAAARAAALNDLGLKPIPPSANGATVLEIVPMKLTTATPILVFQTDAAVGETIDVKIRAKAGDILKWVSYSNNYLVRRGNGEIASLDLSKFNLPQGTYRVEAEVGKIRKASSFFLGVKDAEFESQRREHLKNISQIQATEKKALFYAAQRMEKLTGDLGDQARRYRGQPAQWKKFYASWKKLAKDASRSALGIARSDRPEMVANPDLFNEFEEAVGELNEQAKEVNASVLQKRGVAGVPLPVSRSFKKLKTEASKLTFER